MPIFERPSYYMVRRCAWTRLDIHDKGVFGNHGNSGLDSRFALSVCGEFWLAMLAASGQDPRKRFRMGYALRSQAMGRPCLAWSPHCLITDAPNEA
jgi:hypothetical protein